MYHSAGKRITKLLLLSWSVDLPVLEKEGGKKTFALEHGSAAISGKEGQGFCSLVHWSVDVPQC